MQIDQQILHICLPVQLIPKMHFPLASRFIGLLIVTVCATSPLKQDHHQVAYLHKQDPKLLTRRETPQSPPPEEITVASEMYKACMHFTVRAI